MKINNISNYYIQGMSNNQTKQTNPVLFRAATGNARVKSTIDAHVRGAMDLKNKADSHINKIKSMADIAFKCTNEIYTPCVKFNEKAYNISRNTDENNMTVTLNKVTDPYDKNRIFSEEIEFDFGKKSDRMPDEYKVKYKGMGVSYTIDFQKDKTIYENDLDIAYPTKRALTYYKDGTCNFKQYTDCEDIGYEEMSFTFEKPVFFDAKLKSGYYKSNDEQREYDKNSDSWI